MVMRARANDRKGYQLLSRNIQHYISIFGRIHVYVWFGTCDLTTYNKNNKHISIKAADDSTTLALTELYHKFKTLLARFPDSKLSIFEIPVYSVRRWNEIKVKPDLDDKRVDVTLYNQIHQLNDSIRYLNSTAGVVSPNFSTDLSHRLSIPLKEPDFNNRFNFDLYIDGIHPDKALSKVWLKKIGKQIYIDCWS